MMLVLESLIVYNNDQITIKIIENQNNTKLIMFIFGRTFKVIFPRPRRRLVVIFVLAIVIVNFCEEKSLPIEIII